MTQRNRTRRTQDAPRMDRVFTTTEVAMTIVAGNISVASQQFSNGMSSSFETRTGRSLRNATVGRVWVNGLWFTLAIVTTPVLMGLSMGMGVFSAGMDLGDFPDLATHRGDWMLHRTWRLTDRNAATANATPLEPQHGSENSASIAIDNKSMRKIRRESDELFIVVQKDIATEENIQCHVDVTVMWLVG